MTRLPGVEYLIEASTPMEARLSAALELGAKPSELVLEVLREPDGDRPYYTYNVRKRTSEDDFEADLEGIEQKLDPDEISRVAEKSEGFERALAEEARAEIDRLLGDDEHMDRELIASIRDLSAALDPDLAERIESGRLEAGRKRGFRPLDGVIDVHRSASRREAYLTLRPPLEGGRALTVDDVIEAIDGVDALPPARAELEKLVQRVARPRTGHVVLTVGFRPGKFTLRRTSDDMALLLDVTPPAELGSAVAVGDVLAAVEKEKLSFEPDLKAINTALGKAGAGGENVTDAVIMVGRQPEPGENAVLNWKIPVREERNSLFVPDDAGGPVIVAEDQLLLEKVPATAGRDGMTLRGGVLSAIPGTEIVIGAGARVRKEDRGLRYYSSANGRLLIEQNTLVVRPFEHAQAEIIFDARMLTAELVLTPPLGDGKMPGPGEILEKIRKAGIESTAEIAIVSDLISLLEKTRKVVRQVIARGIEAVPGTPGYVEYPPRRTESQGEPRNERRSVDYRERSAVCAVKEGDIVAIVHSSVQGIPGCNVKGETILPPAVAEVDCEAGPGVIRDGGTFRAARDGHFHVEGMVLHVDELFHVPGDLDLSVGNIRHNGSVVIEGSVGDNFQIEATGEVVIRGNVGASQIRTSGSVRIENGFIGRHRGVIDAGGDSEVRFVENASICAGGAIRVSAYALNSSLEAEKGITIVAKAGQGIVGGLARTSGEIRTSQSSSPAYVPTLLVTGDSPRLLRELRAVEKEFHEVQDDVAKLAQIEAAHKVAATDDTAASHRKLRLIQRLIRSRLALKARLKDLGLRRVQICRMRQETAPGDVIVGGSVYPGTRIAMAGIELNVNSRFESVRFRLDQEESRIRVE